MSTLPPVPAAEMRQLNAEFGEQLRLQRVLKIVTFIYNRAIIQAKTSTNTRYKYEVPEVYVQSPDAPPPREPPPQNENSVFHTTNMAAIISGLQALFPQCVVEFSAPGMEITVDWTP
jgi:hypothetical protein